MQTRFRLVCRGNRGNSFYCVDKQSGKRSSLGKISLAEARQIVHARNEAERQPLLNLQLARAYLAGTDPAVTSRTWRDAILALIETKRADNQIRWRSVLRDAALVPLWSRVIIETTAEQLLKAISSGTVSTNIYPAFPRSARARPGVRVRVPPPSPRWGEGWDEVTSL